MIPSPHHPNSAVQVMPADHMELFYVVRSGAEVIKAHVQATVETLPETLAAARASAGF